MSHKSTLLLIQGKYEEADLLYLRAIEIGEKALVSDHPDLGTWLNNRAESLRAQVRAVISIRMVSMFGYPWVGRRLLQHVVQEDAGGFREFLWAGSSQRGHNSQQPGGVVEEHGQSQAVVLGACRCFWKNLFLLSVHLNLTEPLCCAVYHTSWEVC